jgi:hypothetical protein
MVNARGERGRAMRTAQVLFLCLTTLLSMDACKQNDGEYLITGSKYYRDTSRPPDEDRMLLFTIKHKKITITAHCEVFDVNNRCRELEVGRNYRFTRKKPLTDLLSTEEPHAVLEIQSETTR